MKKFIKIKSIYITAIFIFINIISYHTLYATSNNVHELKNLDIHKNQELKSLRDDVRKSIFAVKSKRPLQDLPELKIYRYKVKKNDTFWTILSKASLNIDTLVSINNLSAPDEITNGKTIFIPNMRGIIVKGMNNNKINKLLLRNDIKPEYVLKINNTKDYKKKYLFIPCAKISNLERSLFLGTGFINPLINGQRTSGFGTRRNPFNKKYFQFHKGIDIACPLKTKIHASRQGKVIFSGYKNGYGRLVILKHEHGYKTYYGHLSTSLIKKGDVIKRGQIIALSGNTGRTTGPHLHFEIRKGNRPLNPSILIHK